MNSEKSIYSSIVKKLYGRFNGKLFPLVAYFFCYIVFACLIVIKKKNQIFIVPTAAIGDTLYILSFWESLNNWAERNGKEVIFFQSDRFKDIFDTYKTSNSRVKVVSLKHLGLTHLFLMMIGGCKYHSLLNNLLRKCGIFVPIPNIYKDYFSKNDKPKGSRHQLAKILNVQQNPISLHNSPLIPIKSIANFEKNKKNICILNPYSYSMFSPIPLFEKIAEKLKEAGFIIYTNVVKGQKEIRGTAPLNCSLQELYSIAKEIPFIVSLRSGILDYLIPSNINMFVVYDKWKISFIEDDDYTLNEWEPKGVLQEVFSRTCSDDEIIQNLHQFLDQLKKGNIIWTT